MTRYKCLGIVNIPCYFSCCQDWTWNLLVIRLRSTFQRNVLSTVFCCVLHETPEEGQRTYRPKLYEDNNEDENNSLNILSDKNYQASSLKFIQIVLILFVYKQLLPLVTTNHKIAWIKRFWYWMTQYCLICRKVYNYLNICVTVLTGSF